MKDMNHTPLEERLRACSDAEAAPNWKIPLACFYEGVTLLAGNKYPEWLNKRIQRAYRAVPTMPFLLMVEHAQNLINRTDDEELSFCGCELMHQLLIQPFDLVPNHKI